ncbi:MAG: 4-fold beta flower protein, partial [Anaerolineae bacterium]
MQPIYRSDGEWVAVFLKGNLFNVDGEWIGFVKGRDVYNSGGHYLGYLSNDRRLLRKRSESTDKSRMTPPPRPERPS